MESEFTGRNQDGVYWAALILSTGLPPFEHGPKFLEQNRFGEIIIHPGT
jgi:hypothetical protein